MNKLDRLAYYGHERIPFVIEKNIVIKSNDYYDLLETSNTKVELKKYFLKKYISTFFFNYLKACFAKISRTSKSNLIKIMVQLWKVVM